MKHVVLRVSIAVALIAAMIFSNVKPAAALSYEGPWYGRQFTCDPQSSPDGYGAATDGYFFGLCPWPLLPTLSSYYRRVVPDGVPTPVNTTAEFFTWLQNLYQAGGRSQTAAAFIVNTMLGNDGPGGGRTVSSAQWSTLQQRLSWHTMSLEQYSTDGINTEMSKTIPGDAGSNPNDYDILAYREQKTATAWVFRDATGAIRYVIFKDCANPVGKHPGLNPTGVDFKLVPTISLDKTNAEQGESVQPSLSVNNTGRTKSSDAQWQLTRFTLAPGVGIPHSTGGLSASKPEDYFGSGAIRVDGASGVNFPTGPTSLSASPYTIGNLPIGSRVCFALSVQPYSQNDTSWNHSAPACVVIAKSPKVQVLGSDLVVGRGSATNAGRISQVITSITSQASTGKTYGSWSEYAIIPTGTIFKMASGSGYSGGVASTSTNSLNLLSFTNKNTRSSGSCPAGSIGCYTQSGTTPNIAVQFPISATTQTIPSTTLDITGNNLSGLYKSTTPAPITIKSSGQVPVGRSVIINAPQATVTINGDIQYTTAILTNTASIPQVVIIAKNIIIANSVQRVDSWLVTTGTGTSGYINTCGAVAAGNPSSKAAPLNDTTCGKPLVVNGPISANKLYLYRTYGAGYGAAAGVPAEVFNLRADAYLWATRYATNADRITTATTSELPPRF